MKDGVLPPDQVIDTLVDASVDAAEREIEHHVVPAFSSVVARAHRLDPSMVHAADVDLASVCERRSVGAGQAGARVSHESTAGEVSEALACFLTDARHEAESDVEQRRNVGIPQFHAPASPQRRWAVGSVAMGTLAAAIVLTLGFIDTWRAYAGRHEHDATQAVAELATTTTTYEALRVDPVGVTRGTGKRVGLDSTFSNEQTPEELTVEQPTVPEEPVPLESGAVQQAAPLATASSDGQRTPTKRVVGRSVRVSAKMDTLTRLDERAKHKLTQGDVAAADRSYAELIRRGGRHRLVELAYGDRFTLAHRRGADAEQERLWRAYLETFPRGRFADDARAGLCRRSDDAQKLACWQVYVRDFPAGTYRLRADRFLERAKSDKTSR